MRPVEVLVLFAVSFVGMVIWRRYRDRAAAERRRQWTEWANARGWRFRSGDAALARSWSGPPFTGDGDVSDVFSGELDGRPFNAFEYSYEEGSGDSAVIRHFMVTAVKLPTALPMLWIAPETGFARLSQRLGSQDIDFESVQFNRTFVVRSDDERYAHAVIHPRMMEYLLNSPARDHSLRIEGDTLLIWESGGISTDRLLVSTGTAVRIAGLIPAHVFQQHSLQQHSLAAQPGADQRPRSYAGSVTGQRPEPTPRDLFVPVGVALWGLLWCLLTSPIVMIVVGYWQGGRSQPSGTGWLLGLGLIPLLGVAAFVFGVVKLVRGLLAIRLNKRDRDRRAMGAAPTPPN